MNTMNSVAQHQNNHEDVLFSFGAISDVQCGDLEDRSIPGLPNRYYRGALSNLGAAVNFWNDRTHHVPAFVLQLGDVIDGFNVTHGGKEQSRQVLAKILKECSAFRGEVHHAWGNHEFYNFTRLELLNSSLFSGQRYLERCHPSAHKQPLSRSHASLTSRNCDSSCLSSQAQTLKEFNDYEFTDENIPSYYDFSPFKGFRFVLLDTFEVSTISYSDVDSPERVAALQILKTHNKNKLLNDFSGLEGKEQRFVSYNGGISNKQMYWLKNVLCRAWNLKEQVVVFGHVPICPEVSPDECLVWNYQDVLTLLQSSHCVIATLFGHTHQYRHHVDEAGIHHFVLPGVVECQPGTNGFMTFDMCAESMIVHRAGEVHPLKLKYSQVVTGKN